MLFWTLGPALAILASSACIAPASAADGDPSDAEIATAQEQVSVLRQRAEMWKAQADLLCSKLAEPGDCGSSGATWADCLNEEIRQIDALMAANTPSNNPSDPLTPDETQELQQAKDASQTYIAACPALREAAPKAAKDAEKAASDLNTPYPDSTFVNRLERSGIASIGFVTSPSLAELAVAGGGAAAAYTSYRTYDQAAADYFKAHPPSAFVTTPGDYYPYVIIPLYGITYIKKWFPVHKPGECPVNGCFSDRFKLMMDTAVGTLATSAALTEGVKYAVGRERPNGTDKLSFWSEHSAFAANLSGACHATMDNWKFCLLFDAGTLLTMNARVEGRWHYPSDTIAGATVGFIISYWGGKKLKNGMAPKVLSFVSGEHTTANGKTYSVSTEPILNGVTKGVSHRWTW